MHAHTIFVVPVTEPPGAEHRDIEYILTLIRTVLGKEATDQEIMCFLAQGVRFKACVPPDQRQRIMHITSTPWRAVGRKRRLQRLSSSSASAGVMSAMYFLAGYRTFSSLTDSNGSAFRALTSTTANSWCRATNAKSAPMAQRKAFSP